MNDDRPSRDAFPGRPTIDRDDIARLLRAARRGDGDDSVEWAYSVMPDSRAARRLRIEQLLVDGDHEAAEAIIARGMQLRCGILSPAASRPPFSRACCCGR